MKLLIFFLLTATIISCGNSEKKKYYIIIDVQKISDWDDDSKTYTLTDSSYFDSDSSAALEGMSRLHSEMEKNTTRNIRNVSYQSTVLDEKHQDINDRLDSAFKERLFYYRPKDR